jgi:hypothetical protein
MVLQSNGIMIQTSCGVYQYVWMMQSICLHLKNGKYRQFAKTSNFDQMISGNTTMFSPQYNGSINMALVKLFAKKMVCLFL